MYKYIHIYIYYLLIYISPAARPAPVVPPFFPSSLPSFLKPFRPSHTLPLQVNVTSSSHLKENLKAQAGFLEGIPASFLPFITPPFNQTN